MQSSNRLLGVLAIAVLVAGVIGFVIEIDPGRYELKGFQMPAEIDARPPSDPVRRAQPARSYDELAVRPWRSGAEAGWQVDGAAMQRAFATASAPERAEHDRTPVALDARAAWRAYEGAPPMIPHPVASSGAAECLACHEGGLQLGRLSARKLPHPPYASCTQCHVADASAPAFVTRPANAGVESATTAPTDPMSTESDFTALRPVPYGPRAWPGAPPAVPHSIQMRGECLACHGPGAREGMRASHPERTSCLQCHATAANLDQRPGGSSGPAESTSAEQRPLPRPSARQTP